MTELPPRYVGEFNRQYATEQMRLSPGAKGYNSDCTHKTFIDRAYLESHMPRISEGFIRSSFKYFPGPWRWVGNHFVFHEMKVIFDRMIESG